MDQEFPITEIVEPEWFAQTDSKVAAAQLLQLLQSGAVTTHEGGFFVCISSSALPRWLGTVEAGRDSNPVGELNALLDDQAELWRLESITVEDAPCRCIFLFRALDMHEALSF